MAKISVIGTGYVGLTSGACFASLGHEVVCADIDPDKVACLNRGEIPIVEAGLEALVEEAVEAGNLSFVLGAASAAAEAEFHYLCVPTPQSEDGSADLTYLKAAAAEIAPVLRPGSVVVNKSTVPVGSTTVVAEALDRDDVFVVSNPEFLREGTAVADFLDPDRVVIGGNDQDAAVRVASLYAKIAAPILITDPLSSELIKYASNAFLASKLSYINAIGELCERVGANVDDVVKGVGADHRIGSNFLSPGPGWGGSCFPKDTVALRRIAKDAGYEFNFLDEVLNINEEQFDRVAQKIANSATSKKVAVLGLTFKAGTDDLRNSPAIEVIQRLIDAGLDVCAFDPVIDETALEKSCPGLAVSLAADPYSAASDASVVGILTEWPEFAELDFAKLNEVMEAATIVDARGLLNAKLLGRRGFRYRGISS